MCFTYRLHDLTLHQRSDKYARKVVIKRAPKQRLNNEREVLEAVRDHPYVRQMIDTTEDPPSLVLKFLDENLLKVSGQKRLEGSDLKLVARNLLEALAALHENGFVHTDIKPNNVLVNYGGASARFSEVQLGDCGDAYRFKPKADPLEEGHVIGAAIFRSPEAMLNLGWGPPTDIWSLGTTLISLVFGHHWHIFKPKNIEPDDVNYGFWVLVEQVRRFGPVPLSYEEIANEDRLGILTSVIDHVNENQLHLPFSMSEDEELLKEDRDFIVKLMKLDPRDRPTATDLLQDEWFKS
ncbi:hypothetical protein OEA41_000981 [Lepraria neglecta]|uniref:Protein kinase domain-containing protein n=1 Tax=Lepraria neglecta TaxID=209136 RepID=A0AAD9ZGN2_9LECA|nr:hypothetical protein OEA41_000981 [Lepraria neglecta]